MKSVIEWHLVSELPKENGQRLIILMKRKRDGFHIVDGTFTACDQKKCRNESYRGNKSCFQNYISGINEVLNCMWDDEVYAWTYERDINTYDDKNLMRTFIWKEEE